MLPRIPQRTAPVTSDITITAVYTPVETEPTEPEPTEPETITHTVTFRVTYSGSSYGYTVKTMTVNDGYVLTDDDYPSVGMGNYGITWEQYTDPIASDVTINGSYSWGGMSGYSLNRSAAEVDTITEEYDYIYAGGKLMREVVTTTEGGTTTTRTLDFFYDANGTPYALKYNGTVYYYVTNLQGDVIRVVDSNGNTVASYEYDPYGKVISATGTLAEINPIRYRGYYYDTETGFYYLNSRFYDPAVDRFINADRQLALKDAIGTNLFAYCFNNPVSLGDGEGNWPKWVEKVACVASVVVTVAAVAVTVAAVSAFTAGTGSALAVYGASIFLGAALSGLNGAIANASQGNSYINGYVGGASAGATQAAASKLPGGTIWGGAGGTGIGTAITMGLNNLDPDSSNSSGRVIAHNVVTSTAKATVTSSITAFWGNAIGGINYNTGAITGAASNGSNGLMPTLTVGFAEGFKAFWGAVDDAFVYVWG